MLRPRVALVLLLFLILGMASTQPTSIDVLDFLLAAIALASTYVVTTSCNDLADYKIDIINHPRSEGRPLARGLIPRSRLIQLSVIAAAISLFAAGLVGVGAFGLVAGLLLLNVLYSLPPVQFSHRPYLVGLTLTTGYVVGPFILGRFLTGQTAVPDLVVLLLVALSMGFLGRINLKDLRDRAGDNAAGKPTLLERHGKRKVISGSILAVVLSLALFAANPLLSIPTRLCVVALHILILFALRELLVTRGHEGEQALIGISAKMGNGVLAILIADLLVTDNQLGVQLVIPGLAVLFLLNGVYLLTHRHLIHLGYRG